MSRDAAAPGERAQADRSERVAGAVLHFVGLALLAHLGFGVFRHAMDLDEFQFLHMGWLVAQGQRPYADFWDDHGPLLPVLCSLFYRAGGSGDAAALFALRSALFALLLLCAALVQRIARRLRPGDAVFPGLALALFAASPVLAHKGIEVRSDNLQHPFWILSLWLWLRAAESGRASAFAGAGLAVGAGFLVTPKAAMLGLAAGGMFAVWMAYRRRLEPAALAAYGLASLVGPALLALWQWSAGAWDAWLAAYLHDSVGRRGFPFAQARKSLELDAPLGSALALGASAVVLLRAAQRRLPWTVACLFVCAASLVYQYLFLLPVHFLHSLIPAAAPVALVTAWALAEGLPGGGPARRAVPRRVALVAVASLVAAYQVSVRRYEGVALQRQLESGARIASRVPAGATLFDGGQLPIERPRPLPAPSLVIHVQQQILAGRFPLDVAAELDRLDVAWWRVDARTRAIERRFPGYREANFVPLDGELWVAGQRLAQGASGGAPFELHVSGLYWWVNARGGALRIDGREVTSPVSLADGRHLAAWDGAGPLLLVAAPPETWPAALRAGIAR